MPNDVVYDLQEETEMFYIVKSGALEVEAEVEITEDNKYPLSMDRWEIKTIKRKVQFKAHTILKDEFFGLQEIVEQLHKTLLAEDGITEIF